MLGVKFIRSSPLRIHCNVAVAIVRDGLELSFFCYALATSLVRDGDISCRVKRLAI
jgi:hypothetical protein